MSARLEELKAELRAEPGLPYVTIARDLYDELAGAFRARFAGAGLRVEGHDVSVSDMLAPGTWRIEL